MEKRGGRKVSGVGKQWQEDNGVRGREGGRRKDGWRPLSEKILWAYFGEL